MLRFLALFVVVFVGVQMPGVARASTDVDLTYGLTLTPTVGSIGGSGLLDVTAPSNGSGTYELTGLSLSIDGANFTLGDEVGNATATLSDGVLTGLNYVGALINDLNLDILGSTGLTYAFIDIGTGATIAAGTITDPPVPSTPLPPTLILFASGLLALGFITRWRKLPNLPRTLSPATLG